MEPKQWQAACTLCGWVGPVEPSISEADAHRHQHYIAVHAQATHVRIVEPVTK